MEGADFNGTLICACADTRWTVCSDSDVSFMFCPSGEAVPSHVSVQPSSDDGSVLFCFGFFSFGKVVV